MQSLRIHSYKVKWKLFSHSYLQIKHLKIPRWELKYLHCRSIYLDQQAKLGQISYKLLNWPMHVLDKKKRLNDIKTGCFGLCHIALIIMQFGL